MAFLMCGLAGSGKTELALQLEAAGCARLSLDEEIWHRFGRYGHDYPPHQYDQYQIAAEADLSQRLLELLDQGRHVVLDFSFWQRSMRYTYTSLIRQHGGTPQIIYLRLSPVTLRRRLEERSRHGDANAAFPVSLELLQKFIDGFEAPVGEDCWVVDPEAS
ncbi:MAG: hypothetical protein E1N59_1177 [Puniceicoccaceae bacterium 5H]|nr:MAG: hypothetical protein E1N59_1177 [Puniceicoccaceae bacterium 5H]